MFCTKCGAQLPEGTKVCQVCGSPPGAEKKKGVLSIFFKLGTAAAWVIGILFVIGLFMGDDPVDRVKNVVFDQYGTITVGEMVAVRNGPTKHWTKTAPWSMCQAMCPPIMKTSGFLSTMKI